MGVAGSDAFPDTRLIGKRGFQPFSDKTDTLAEATLIHTFI